VKAFLAEDGLIENYLRLPLVPLSKELHRKLQAYHEASKVQLV
jgi:dihydrodipicolinate synthase/N-acetylneuraminate lyase